MSWLSDALGGRSSAGKKSAKKRRAAAKKRAAARAAANKRAAAQRARNKAREQAQAQARAQQAAQQRAAEAAEKRRIAEAKALSDKRVGEFNTSLASAKEAGTKEMQLLRVQGLQSEDERVRALASGITENKATALDAPDRTVSQQKASVKKKIKSRSSGSSRRTTLGSLGGGNTFSLG